MLILKDAIYVKYKTGEGEPVQLEVRIQVICWRGVEADIPAGSQGASDALFLDLVTWISSLVKTHQTTSDMYPLYMYIVLQLKSFLQR